jgi:hypothetical protein
MAHLATRYGQILAHAVGQNTTIPLFSIDIYMRPFWLCHFDICGILQPCSGENRPEKQASPGGNPAKRLLLLQKKSRSVNGGGIWRGEKHDQGATV